MIMHSFRRPTCRISRTTGFTVVDPRVDSRSRARRSQEVSHRQPDRDPCPALRPVGRSYNALMLLHNLLHDGEAEAGAALAAGEEKVEKKRGFAGEGAAAPVLAAG